MNALEKLKLSKELRSLLGGMDGLKAMEKLKAAKRVRELVALLGGGSGQSNNELEYAIKIAADSLDQLRKSDVYRVLTENPENIRAALATYIKNGRPDLAQEVDEVLQELDEEAAAAEEKQKPVWKAYWMGESREAFVIRDSAEKMASYIAENSIKNFFVYQSSGEKLLDVYVSGDYMEPIGYLMPRERATLNEYQADLVNAKAGRGLGKVLGRNHNRVYNDSKKVAIEWLNKNIAEYSTLIKAMEQAKTAPAWPFATADAQTPSNPLYQSVIDGAEITVALLDQIIKEAEANGDADDPQLAQAVEVIEQWATARGWERAVLDSLFAAVFGGVQGAA